MKNLFTKPFLILATLLLVGTSLSAQTFSGGSGGFPDNTCDASNQFSATVAGVGTLTTDAVTNVTIDVSHSWTSDLDISLISPSGTIVDLSSDNGGSGDNYTNTQFEDNGVDGPITGGSPPFTGVFIPEQLLSTFCGENADGDWILQVCDDASGITGSVNSWSITFAPSGTCSCVMPQFTVMVDDSNCPTIDLIVDVTSLGSAGSVDISESSGTDSETGVGIGQYILTGYSPGDGTLTVTVSDNADATCNATDQASIPSACPPANDACVNAIGIGPGANQSGTLVGATDVEGLSSCSGGGGTGSIDWSAGVWYVYTSTGSEDITISTSNAGTNFDTELQVFSGACGALSCVGGDDDGGSGVTSEMTFTSTASFAPVDYYFYVDGHAGATGNFELSIANVPLPVTLVSFEGRTLEKNNQLSWVTASEQNTELFAIQRSTDGVNWQSIGRTAANGFAAAQQSYEFVDETPLAKGFYRLEVLDYDGSLQYSNVLTLERDQDGFRLTNVFPNPTSDMVTVQFKQERNDRISLRLTDMLGRVVLADAFDAADGTNDYQLDLSQLAEGLYFLQLDNGQNQLTQRLMKN